MFFKRSAGNRFIFIFSPFLILLLILVIWAVAPYLSSSIIFSFSLITTITILRFGVYPLILSGWSSNRNYSIIGGIRGVAQTVSYEIRFALIILVLASYYFRLKTSLIVLKNIGLFLLLVAPFLFVFWFVSLLAESNRTPFDFAEGESELVSGFNIEYGAGGFVLIFMAEYGMILFLRTITRSLFLITSTSLLHRAGVTLIVFLWVWARATFPRYRYDLLIDLAWKRILPISLGMLLLFSSVAFTI